jgi:hypothetical protein
MDDQLLAIINELFEKAEPKRDTEMKTVPSITLDRLSERLAALGIY